MTFTSCARCTDLKVVSSPQTGRNLTVPLTLKPPQTEAQRGKQLKYFILFITCVNVWEQRMRGWTSLFSCFVLFKGEICALQFLVRLLSSCRNEFHWSECWSFTIKAGGILSGTSMFKLVQHPRDYFQQRSNPLSLETPLSPCWKEATSSLHVTSCVCCWLCFSCLLNAWLETFCQIWCLFVPLLRCLDAWNSVLLCLELRSKKCYCQ